MDQVLGFERAPNRANPPVHHVARRDDVHTGLRLNQRLLYQYLYGFVVQDVAVFAGVGVEQAVLAMAGERVERHVGHHAKLWKACFQRPYHPGHQTVRVQRFLAIGRLERSVDHRKQRHHRYAQADAFFRDRQQQIEAEPLDAGHRRHSLTPLLSVQHKYRVDQVMGAEGVFAHQVACEGVATQAARTGEGVGRKGGHGRVGS